MPGEKGRVCLAYSGGLDTSCIRECPATPLARCLRRRKRTSLPGLQLSEVWYGLYV
jgi:hypothetical protein